MLLKVKLYPTNEELFQLNIRKLYPTNEELFQLNVRKFVKRKAYLSCKDNIQSIDIADIQLNIEFFI